jgi:threonylcarbamoyladenosine tRNA methylthiotransferase MtaB
MPAVPGPVVRERAAQLRAAGEQRVAAHLAAMRGRTVQLLIEQPGLGRTEGFARTTIEGDHPPGSLVMARITGATGEVLTAEAA